jgi:hypothetical protein
MRCALWQRALLPQTDEETQLLTIFVGDVPGCKSPFEPCDRTPQPEQVEEVRDGRNGPEYRAVYEHRSGPIDLTGALQGNVEALTADGGVCKRRGDSVPAHREIQAVVDQHRQQDGESSDSHGNCDPSDRHTGSTAMPAVSSHRDRRRGPLRSFRPLVRLHCCKYRWPCRRTSARALAQDLPTRVRGA